MLNFNYVKLKNFKSYKNQRFDFSPLTVFCGTNSVGKSTAIQSLGIFLQSAHSSNLKLNGELVHIGNIDEIHNFHNQNDDLLTIEISTSNEISTWGYDNAEGRDLHTNGYELILINNIINTEKKTSKTRKYKKNDFNYQYLHADRFGPRDNLSIGQHNYNENWLGTKGEHTVEVLENLINKKRMNLPLFDDMREDPRKHASTNNNNVLSNIEAWMNEITPGYTIIPKKITEANVTYNSILTDGKNTLKPINIGFGYSYALSVVSSLLISDPGDVVIIENPEAHLHPKGQSFIGRLIALAAEAGIQVIIETHSDHVINGIRLMARAKKVDSEKITFFQVSQQNHSSEVININLDDEARFSSWPDDFFDQQVIDMNLLISGEI